MSDFHQAVYRKIELSRTECSRQIKSLFRQHKIRFTHNVRGLYWSNEWNEFIPNIEQELEGIDRFDVAVSATLDWNCVCFDLRFQQWSIELYFIKNKKSETVVLSFPNSVYKLAFEDSNIAENWLGLSVGVGNIFGGVPMICGPDVQLIASSEERLMARFHHYLKDYKKGTYSVHTVLCKDVYKRQFEAFINSDVKRPFHVTTIAKDYHQITLLNTINRDRLNAIKLSPKSLFML